jgi:hypothetical protein
MDLPGSKHGVSLADIARRDLQQRNTELVLEARMLRADLAAANARPIILWTVTALALVAVLCFGASLALVYMDTPQVVHCSADDYAPPLSEAKPKVRR